MKQQILTVIAILLMGPTACLAQVGYSSYVDSIVGLTDTSNIKLIVRQLSGDTSVMINGELHTITTRNCFHPHKYLAKDYITAKFTEYGYTPEIQTFYGDTGKNVIATKVGTLYPDKYLIICGHYDCVSPDQDLAPGADDNASGTAAVLEAARLFKDLPSLYSISFIAFDMEEIGFWGSQHYVEQAELSGMDIVGAITLDMIGYNSDNDLTFIVSTEDNESQLALDAVVSAIYYSPQLVSDMDEINGSDNYSFWLSGYPAIGIFESIYDFNPGYHTIDDVIGNFDMDYYFAIVRTAYSTLLSNTLDYRFIMTHEELISTGETTPRLAEAIITGPFPVAQGENRPRLYYSTDSVNYEYVQSFESVGDTFRFMIPGVSLGTTVNYYFSAQDEEANFSMTLPYGGRETVSQGSTPPPKTFHYLIQVLVSDTVCSKNTPIPLPVNTITYDEILITRAGCIEDLDVLLDITHSSTDELTISLTGPDFTYGVLADRVGGHGNNYTQTIFDDYADVPIYAGLPPFTGRYRPLEPLDRFRNKSANGIWRIEIKEFDNTSPGGSLNSWCLQLLYPDTTVNVINRKANDFTFNCYPNPVIDNLEMEFTVNNQTHVNVEIYNLTGSRIKSISQITLLPGNNLVVTPIDLQPGIYLIKAISDNQKVTKKMVVI